MEMSTPRCVRGFGVHKPRSSSAVRESRFTAADLGGRKVEELPVADATFFLAPFMRVPSFERERDGHTARAQLIGCTIDFRGERAVADPPSAHLRTCLQVCKCFLNTQAFRPVARKPLYFSVCIQCGEFLAGTSLYVTARGVLTALRGVTTRQQRRQVV